MQPSVRRVRRGKFDAQRRWLAALLLVGITGGTAAVYFRGALQQFVTEPIGVSLPSQAIIDPTPQITYLPPPVAPRVQSISQISKPSLAPPPRENVHTLWLAALDAESQCHFAAAVKLYERIQNLSGTDRPANLQTRLELARQELVAGLH